MREYVVRSMRQKKQFWLLYNFGGNKNNNFETVDDLVENYSMVLRKNDICSSVDGRYDVDFCEIVHTNWEGNKGQFLIMA